MLLATGALIKTFFLDSFPIWYAMRIASALSVKSTCIQIQQYIEIITFYSMETLFL